jgi:hypothetical protein
VCDVLDTAAPYTKIAMYIPTYLFMAYNFNYSLIPTGLPNPFSVSIHDIEKLDQYIGACYYIIILNFKRH